MFQNLQSTQLLIEPLVGYRCFQARSDGTLFSMNNVRWPVDGLEATCTTHLRAPEKYCGCGIYASKSMSWLVKQSGYWPPDNEKPNAYTAPRLVASVHLWGLVQQYSEGYRAEWARPLVVYYTKSTFELAKLVAAKYGILYDNRPDMKPEVDEERESQLKQLELMRAKAAEERKRAYLKKRAEQQAMLNEALKRGLVDAKGNLTQAGADYIKQRGGKV